ncbi:methyl-accepting chemotaxis protein [Halarcobacter bivalviorum]|uniref:Cache sensor-containing MCP-domain signal transduction protein n=1 Tax=Halarcobacter bivalviorum TaxID=663364 RepID=A0AAX2A9W5_9BACT|nr:cache domain-containing protein [Halarcobacter bivalviorum]AXH12689.1 Cache sensor-containing MCP-domain signal transduction protein [Halarcobacter bivalviorum]RXK10387.1 chemotaxis protein [Halarcobacter bivalviorum]
MINNASIKVKLLSTVIIAILVVAFYMLFELISSLKHEAQIVTTQTEKTAYENKEQELKNYVSLAFETVESYYERTSKEKVKSEVESYITEQSGFLFSIIEAEYEKNKNILSEQALKEKIMSIVESTRYGTSGYFWINDFNYKMVMHPIKKELSGQYFKNTPKVPFVELGVDALKKVKEDQTFIEYSFYNPSSKKTVFKASIVKVFKPYNWIIGTGAYIDDISEKMKQEALKAIASMKYGDNGYFWVNDSNHVVTAHGASDALVGKNMKDLQDKKGKYLYQEIVKTANASKEGGLVKYFWTIPGREGDFEKFSYVQRFEPWDMIIGTGSYIVDTEEQLQKLNKLTEENISSSILNSVITVLILLVVLTVLVIFILNKVVFNPLSYFQNGLLDFFKYVNKETENINPIEVTANDEIGKMASLINENINKTKTIIEQDNKVISDVKTIVNRVSDGYLENRISSTTNNESLEELKNLLNNMLDNLEKLVGKNINALSEVLEQYANRDFTKTLDSSTSGKIGNDILNLNKMITTILQDNKEDGETLQDKSTELSTNVRTLSENATSQAASLEETAASIEEITGNIRQTNEKAQQMLKISSQTQNSAHKGKDLATRTSVSMEEINEKVTMINEAITVIDQIAFQTNILSLNAAVEAATAGEAGKGFAVVAAEVRNLASRSAEAAKEIKELVEDATIKANDGKNISSEMINGFQELEENIKLTNNLINDVTNAANEQSSGMNQISDAVNQLDRFTQENASIADKTNFIAQETNSIANDIVEAVNRNKFNQK